MQKSGHAAADHGGKERRAEMSVRITEEEWEKLTRLIRSTRDYLKDQWSVSQVYAKGKADYVTNVDQTVQSYIAGKLKEWFPYIDFMGEEKDNRDVNFDGPVWILDPIDGTTNLIHDFRHSAVSLALYENREGLIGLVYQPYTDELFYGKKGEGAFLNGQPISVSKAKTLEDSLIAVGTSPYRKDLARDNFELFTRIFLECQDIRRTGSAALDLAYTACGRLEAYIEKNLKPWDFAAGALIVKEAGGQVFTYDGSPLSVERPCDVAAGNGIIQQILIEKYLKSMM